VQVTLERADGGRNTAFTSFTLASLANGTTVLVTESVTPIATVMSSPTLRSRTESAGPAGSTRPRPAFPRHPAVISTAKCHR
jgi:hypothetical protein